MSSGTVGRLNRSDGSSAVTGRAIIDWTPTEQALVDASYSRGYRGGIDDALAFQSSAQVYFVKPETAKAFEIGFGGGYGIAAALSDGSGPRPNGRLLVFALDANAPYKVERTPAMPAVVVKDAFTPAQVALGGKIYEDTCAVCHGVSTRSSGVVPDLRRVPELADKATWNTIVIGGVLKSKGMISFKPWLNDADAEAVRAYVAGRARHLAEAGN